MQKIIKIDNKVIVMFEDGSYCERDNVSKEEFETIVHSQNDEEIFAIMCPDFAKKKQEYITARDMETRVSASKLLTLKGESIYWEEVAQLSVPIELAKAILDAEEVEDVVKLETYKNFWTLMCLNPDERCRKNLFWFLNKNGLVISRCGFFVAYRNADFLKQDPDGTEVYTDAHSHTFEIRIGEVVTMPRGKCDPVQENTCSKGLHLGAKWWLQRNYFGNQGLVCLCNPADVVAVP